MFGFKSGNVGDGQGIAGILLHLCLDRDHHQRPQRVSCGQFIDGRVFRRPVGGRIKLGAQLIGAQVIARRLKAMLFVSERLVFLSIAVQDRAGLGRGKRRAAKAGPHRDCGRDGVGQVHILRPFQMLVINLP